MNENTAQEIHRRCHSVRDNPHGFESRDAGAIIEWANLNGIEGGASEIMAAYCGSLEDDGQCPHA